MRYCKRCVQPDSRPGIHFNSEGICGACMWEDEKRDTDWGERFQQLKEVAEWAKRTTKHNYDCVIGISGGKDSTFQSLYARDKLGLRPLLVNSEPEGITEIGRRNIENLKNLGFDALALRPNPVVMKRLMRKDFYRCLNPVKVTEYSLYSSAYIVAYELKIPLIIQGENDVLTLGVRNLDNPADGNALNADRQNTLSTDWREYIGDGVTEKDLYLFHYDRKKMEQNGFKGVWLQYYAKEWSQPGNALFSMGHGLTVRSDLPDFNPYDIGTYAEYAQLDSDIVQLNQMLKYVKFGFGQCVDHACYDIRDGRITREEGIRLIKEFDGRCADKYVKKFCDSIDITVAEFWRVANSFRGEMWKKDAGGKWVLANPIWEREPYEKDKNLDEILAKVRLKRREPLTKGEPVNVA